MKNICITILVFVSLCSYGQKEKANNTVKNTSNDVFTGNSYIAVIHYDSIETFYQQSIFNYGDETYLTKADASLIEKLLNKCVKEYNAEQVKRHEKDTINLKKYKRQYVSIRVGKSGKEVFVNCFCITYDNYWRKELVIVKGGGHCYFQVRINLKKKTFDTINIGGIAS